LRHHERLACALSAITAAVVGVILNLAVWFGVQVLFPQGQAMDWFAAVITGVVFFGMKKWGWEVVPVVLGAGAVGLMHAMIVGPAS
jgi:chromate transporter